MDNHSIVYFPRMLSVRDAASASELAPSRIRELCRSGCVPFIRAGKRWLVNGDRLAEFLNRGEQVPPQSASCIRRVEV